jgi:hypothetical protein
MIEAEMLTDNWVILGAAWTNPDGRNRVPVGRLFKLSARLKLLCSLLFCSVLHA